MKSRHFLNCSLPRWLPLFKDLSLKTSVIPLSADFIEYLNADGIHLPVDENGNHIELYKRDFDEDFESTDENDARKSQFMDPELLELSKKFQSGGITDDDDDDEEDQDSRTGETRAYHFPELDQEIQKIIEKYDGMVFPKLDWSSPRDACWMATTGSLKCTKPADIYLLLKSSDFIAHDLNVDQEGAEPHQFHLCLKKWYDLHPAMEFRCFVRNHQLLAWCQRDHQNHYPFLQEMKPNISEALSRFFMDHIKGKFFEEADYVLDLYATRRDGTNSIQRICLVDINPWCKETTDSLLFDWDELNNEIIENPHRIIENEEHARQHQHSNPKFITSMLPKEAIALGEFLS